MMQEFLSAGTLRGMFDRGDDNDPLLQAWLDAASRRVDIYDYSNAFETRRKFCRTHAWAVPCKEAIDVLVEHSPLIEIGAGKGYWAWLASKAGADILAFDLLPNDNHYCDGSVPPWFLVQHGGASAVSAHPGRTLFMCWAPYQAPMASACLGRYKGEKLIWVGEGDGGCCGDDRFWKMIEDGWEETRSVNLPNWTGVRDYLSVYERKKR